MARAKYSRRAIADIAAQDDYLRPLNPAAANAVLDEIEAMADLLVDFPKLGRLIDDTSLRYIVTRKYRYRIVYRLEQSELRIVQVLHPRKE